MNLAKSLAIGAAAAALAAMSVAGCAFASAQNQEAGASAPPVAERVLWVDQANSLSMDSADAGSEAAPFKTISGAAQFVKPGDLVLIRTGVYREHVDIKASGLPDKPIRFEAAPAAHVVVSGADCLEKKAFVREPGDSQANYVFSVDWPYKLGGTHPNDDYHAMVGRREQVVVNSRLMHQVLEKSQLSRGSFYVDYEKRKLYLWHPSNIDLSSKSSAVEISTRPAIWTMAGNYLRTRGLVFRYAANHAQNGSVRIKGSFNSLEDCVVEFSNGAGLSITGEDVVVKRCIVRGHGQLGVGACGAHRLLMADCEIRENSTKGYNGGWEAGADKFCLCKDLVLERCVFADNNGNGIWFDIGNENPEVRNCLIKNNSGGGIFYEISYGLRAHDNVIVGNGFEASHGSWGADGAINLSSSPGCVIERNLMIGNQNGFQFREQTRTTPRIGAGKGVPEEPVWNHDQVVRNNVMAFNSKWQLGGWFDVKDGRHWPAAMRSAAFQKRSKTEAEDDIAKDYLAKDSNLQPDALSLEKLNLVFEGNLYGRSPGQGLFLWGVTWRDHKEYSSIESFNSELKLEDRGVEAPLEFADFASLDLRVPEDSPALKMNCYPRGCVPGVKLGVMGK